MNCSHCQHWNPEDEQRCRLCGRKLNSSGNDTSEWLLNVVAGNLATAPERVAKRRAAAAGSAESSAIERHPGPQRSLFPDTRPPSKIIPFESRSGGGAAAAAAPALAKIPSAPRRTTAPKSPPAARRDDRQHELDLMLPAAPIAPKTLKTTVEASIYCDATVATLPHRALAGVVDFSLILIQYILCVGSYWFMGGSLPSTKFGYGAAATAFVTIALFYGLIWALGNMETPGMHWAKLRLTNFDGQDPELPQRLQRYFGTCLSVATGGCGLLWALVDEENLAWQDHMSRTFPTFQRPDSNLCKSR